MINKINGVNFQGKYQKFVKPVHKSTQIDIKRGLKAAGIYAASTIATTLGILACRGKVDYNAILDNTNKCQPIENLNIQKDTLTTEEVAPADKILRPLNKEGGLIVQEGDSYWKIATDLLIDKGIEKPTDTQIWKEMSRLMEVNSRFFEEEIFEDDVPIYPGEYIYIKEIPIDYD